MRHLAWKEAFKADKEKTSEERKLMMTLIVGDFLVDGVG